MRLTTFALIGAVAMAAPLVTASLATPAHQDPPAAGCDTDAECAALPACALKPGCDGGPYTEPFRLVGYGCEGMAPGAVLYADEEDHFPRCRRIEATFGG